LIRNLDRLTALIDLVISRTINEAIVIGIVYLLRFRGDLNISNLWGCIVNLELRGIAIDNLKDKLACVNAKPFRNRSDLGITDVLRVRVISPVIDSQAVRLLYIIIGLI